MYSIYEHVHLNEKGDDTVRKKDDSLRGALIDYARELAEKEGPGAVNIRSLARKASLTIPSSEAMIATEKMIRATAEETICC